MYVFGFYGILISYGQEIQVDSALDQWQKGYLGDPLPLFIKEYVT